MEELNNMQKKCYVTIDFEDFSHDFKRSVLFEKDPKINEEALNKSYEYIKYLLKKLIYHPYLFLKVLCTNRYS